MLFRSPSIPRSARSDHPNQTPEYPGADENQTRNALCLGKGSFVAAASTTRTTDPTPEVQFREIWQIAQAERMGFDATDEFLQNAQLSAPDGAAGSSTDAIAPVTLLPRSNRYRCLQCRELAAAEDLWQCEHCTRQAGKSICFHPPFALPQLFQGPRTFLQNGDNVRMASRLVVRLSRSQTSSETLAAPRLSCRSDELAR